MEENTQLPVEVVEQIKTNAALRCDRNEGKDDNSFRNGYYSGYVSGATAYATKLHQLETHNGLLKTEIRHLNTVIEKLQQENDRLTVELQTAIDAYEVHKNAVVHYKNTKQKLQQENEKMKAQAQQWRPLLEDILREDDNNIACVSVDLLNKIKKFLYGE